MDRANDKALLARLLATENITVIHKKIPTAMFDVKGRTLMLPIWKEMAGDIYDMLIGHEVGHALFTPKVDKNEAGQLIDPKNVKIAALLMNVVEDARIEKLIKRRYPGLRGNFVRAYRDLTDRDFFRTKGKDLTQLNLIDRLNLHFKCGASYGIQFNEAEEPFVKMLSELESWDDSVRADKALYEYMKMHPETQPPPPPQDGESGEESDESGESSDSKKSPKKKSKSNKNDKDKKKKKKSESEKSESEESESDDSEESEESDDSDGSGESEGEENESEGEESNDSDSEGDSEAEGEDSDDDSESDAGNAGESEGEESDLDGEGEAADDADGEEGDSESETDALVTPTEHPEPAPGGNNGAGSTGAILPDDAPDFEIGTQQSFNDLENSLVDATARDIHYVNLPRPMLKNSIVPFKDVHKEIYDYYAQKPKGDPSRVDEAKKRLLDFTKENSPVIAYLAKEFEINKAADEQRRTQIATSGMLDTRKLHRYKFSEDIFKRLTSVTHGKNHGLVVFVDWSGSMSTHLAGTFEQLFILSMFCRKVNIPFDVYTFGASDRYNTGGKKYFSETPGEMRLGCGNLRHFLSSEMSGSQYQAALINLMMLRIGSCERGSTSPENGMGGTPLNEAIISCSEVVKQFRLRNNVQIVNAIFITDGDANSTTEVIGDDGRRSMMIRGGDKVIMRDQDTKREYVATDDWDSAANSITAMLLQWLREKMEINVIGFFITASTRAANLSHSIGREMTKEDQKSWTKDGFVKTTQRGYTEYYVIPGGNALNVTSAGLNVTGPMTVENVKKAFLEQNKGRLKSRVLLGRFVKLIAGREVIEVKNNERVKV